MSRETLILFTRYPEPGRTKTRLIPKLGMEGAAELQRDMTEHVLTRVWPLVRKNSVNVEVWYDGGSEPEMRRWLGRGIKFVAQEDGELGKRMRQAVERSVSCGAKRVLIIGADCPGVDASLLSRAFELLRSHPLIFGPARDGGYYLIGLREAHPFLFENINWGTGEVLAASLARARESGLEPFLLPELADVDAPEDLTVWETARRTSRSLSVVIPALNEAARLPRTLERVAAEPPGEIIVVDGGSHDDTIRVAEAYGAKVATCTASRARQLNAGAALAQGEILLFLHADTLLPGRYCREVLSALRLPQVAGGAFRFAVAEPFAGRWLLEASTNLRSRLWRMPYGDQAVFVRRWVFDEINGFPELPIMEDYEFVRRLRRFGELKLLDSAVLTSGRRWQRLGFLRATLINKLVILGYRCGVSPEKLLNLYRGSVSEPKPHRGVSKTPAEMISKP